MATLAKTVRNFVEQETKFWQLTRRLAFLTEICFAFVSCQSIITLSHVVDVTLSHCHMFQVVGILMRARRQGFVDFEGEMLFQRRDDHVVIRLVKSPDELEADVEKQRGELRVRPSQRK